MGENKNTQTSITCPFCGAPQTNIVPSSVAQVKCKYCGHIFPISPYLKDVVPRCPNHPQNFAIGLCNDCGESFCTQCLQVYDLKTEHDEARLHLCHSCFQQRELKKADNLILVGAVMVLFCAFGFLFSPIVGILLILLVSVPTIAYGLYKRSSILAEEQPTTTEKETVMARKPEVSEFLQDADVLYGKMLGKYASKWGVVSGKDLLDNEIAAYVRSGLSYEEAVCRVALSRGLIKAESAARTETESETEKE